MDYSYSYGGQFQQWGWPFYRQLVIVVQVPAYTDTGMQQRNYRPQTRNCTKNTSRTQKSNRQKRRDHQQRKAFYSWKYVCASMPWYHHSIPGRSRSMTFTEMVGLFCCFTSQVNSYGHCGTVSSPRHTFSWASLNKQLTSTSCTYLSL